MYSELLSRLVMVLPRMMGKGWLWLVKEELQERSSLAYACIP